MSLRGSLTFLSVAALFALAPAANAEVLYEQGPSSIGFHPTSQDFEPSLDSSDALAADDFQVPVGEVWAVDRAFVDGRKPFDSGDRTTSIVNTSLFEGQGSFPASDPFYSRQLTAAPGTPYPDFDLALPEVPLLPAGTWWLAAQPRMDFNPGESYWVWGTDPDLVGNPAAWRNPGDGLGTGCVEFGLMSECADTDTGDVINPDLSFRLEGVRASGDFAVTESKSKRKGKLSLTVNAPNLGTLEVASKQMKPATVEVTALGEVELKLKPTRKTKGKLADDRRPKAKLTLELPPYFDGTPLEAAFKKKLKP